MRRILAADIGGTNSRFGFFELPGEGAPVLAGVVRLATTGAESFPALLEAVFASGPPFAARACDAAVLAVPGPVVGGAYCHPPNIRWDFDLADAVRLGLANAVLINDFAAQAWACRSEAVLGARVLQAGKPDPQGVVAVIGAGTGLGHCALAPLTPLSQRGPSCAGGRGGWLALPSESGHAAFPFVGEAEAAYGESVRRGLGHPYCTGDDIVTGGGLRRVHAHLTGEDLPPAEVGARLAEHPRTVEWFARFYGRACRHYALAVLAGGGVYVTGGVAANSPALVEHPAFLEEFRLSRTHGALLAAMPVVLNTNQDSGMFGAALAATQMLRHSAC